MWEVSGAPAVGSPRCLPFVEIQIMELVVSEGPTIFFNSVVGKECARTCNVSFVKDVTS
jgi:hypothetical protein